MTPRNQGANAMVDPSLLSPGDWWEYRCLFCPDALLQGGWFGVLQHFRVIHPDRPDPKRPTDAMLRSPNVRNMLRAVPANYMDPPPVPTDGLRLRLVHTVTAPDAASPRPTDASGTSASVIRPHAPTGDLRRSEQGMLFDLENDGA